MGARAGNLAIPESGITPWRLPEIPLMRRPEEAPRFDWWDLRASIKSVMWRKVGIVRKARELQEVKSQLNQWLQITGDQVQCSLEAEETHQMITLGLNITEAALFREESRGVHYREDFPETNNKDWACRIVTNADGKARKVSCQKQKIAP